MKIKLFPANRQTAPGLLIEIASSGIYEDNYKKVSVRTIYQPQPQTLAQKTQPADPNLQSYL